MISFFKKDFLVYWRDRKEIIISLITPMVLITVLSLALPGWVENSTKSLQMKVAFVNLDDERTGLQQIRELLSQQTLPQETKDLLGQQLEQSAPAGLFKQVLQEDSVKEIVTLVELDNEEALRRLEDGQIDALFTIPEGFTFAVLNKMLLNEGEGSEIRITADDGSLQVDVLKDIIGSFTRTLNLQAAIRHVSAGNPDLDADRLMADSEIGGREIVPGVKIVTSFQYYALAISIVFALMISVTVSSKAIAEKREHTFERILLAGSKPVNYLSGKMSSTICLSLAQLVIVLLLSHFIFGIFTDRSWQFWTGMAAVLIMMSVCMGALSSLFTALVFRLDDQAASGISFIAVIIAGSIGGSFVPVYVLPEWLQAAGEWTPNGLGLSVLLKWLQTETINDLSDAMLKLAAFSIISFGLAVWIFPKRGRVQ